MQRKLQFQLLVLHLRPWRVYEIQKHQIHFHGLSWQSPAFAGGQPLQLVQRSLRHHLASSIRCAHEGAQNSLCYLSLMMTQAWDGEITTAKNF